MRHRAQDLLSPIAQRQMFEQCLQARLILHIENILELGDLIGREFHSINNPAKEIHTSKIDLKSLNTEPLKCFNRNQQNFNVCSFTGAPIVLNTDLCELSLPATFRFFEPQYFPRIVKPDRFWRSPEPCCDGFGNKRREFGP